MVRRPLLSPVFSLLCVVIALSASAAAHAQDLMPTTQARQESVPEWWASPHNAVDTFLNAMGQIETGQGDPAHWWDAARALLDTSRLSEEQVRPRAQLLYEVLRKVGLPEAGVPDAVGIGERTRYKLFPNGHGVWVWPKLEQRGAGPGEFPRGEIVLAKDAQGRWRFTAETLAQIDALAEALAPLPPNRLEDEAPESAYEATSEALSLLGPTFTRTSWWGWGILLIAIFLGLAAGRIVKTLLRRGADRLHKSGRAVRATVFEDLASPLSLALLTVGISVGQMFVFKQPDVQQFAWNVLAFLYVIAISWFGYNLVDVIEVGLRRITQRTSSKLDDTIVPLVRKTLRIFLVIVVTLFVAQNIFGLNITGWLAGLGIAGLAVSLAAQDSVKNLFGSLMIYFDRPFAIGDWVIFNGNEGYIEEIGFRSTRLRLWSRHQVTIPNMHFNDGVVTNVARRPLDRRVFDVTITYDTPPDKVQQAVDILNEIMHEDEVAAAFDLDNYPPHIGFSAFNDASLNIRVYYYYMQQIPGRNYWTYFEHAHMVNMKILERFNEAGIDFAFPTQTLHLAGDPKRELAVRLLENDLRSPRDTSQ